jgi:predicted DNA-binding transcriptional regulator YafY
VRALTKLEQVLPSRLRYRVRSLSTATVQGHEHSCRLRTHTDTLEWIAFRLMMLGCDFTVHEPPELIGYLRTLGARITGAVR